jgi:phosphoglycerate dehydrogenase-like enzyme
MPRPLPRVLTHLPKGLLDKVFAAYPEIEVIEVPGEGQMPAGTRGEVLLTQTWGTPNLSDVLACGVEWVHTYGTGVNSFPFHALTGQALTCSRGASAIPISEWVLAMLLAFEKQLPDIWLDEPAERWNIASLGGLYGSTLGLVGLGGIAQAVATRALAFGMKVRALRRTNAPSPVEGVEVVTSLDDLLASADHVVIAAPATENTKHLFDAAAFARMKPGSHLVNIARGDLVDQDALRVALDEEQLALASLDTVTPEPLPAGHWLYSHPKVRLSAHVSWSMPNSHAGLIDPFVTNLQRFQDEEALIYRVNAEEGY